MHGYPLLGLRKKSLIDPLITVSSDHNPIPLRPSKIDNEEVTNFPSSPSTGLRWSAIDFPESAACSFRAGTDRETRAHAAA